MTMTSRSFSPATLKTLLCAGVVSTALGATAFAPVAWAAQTAPPALKPGAFPFKLSALAARLPDGSVFLPVTAQFQLGLRTVTAEATTARQTFKLAGQVLRDPNYSGAVQATQPGVVSAPPGGLPTLGQRVAKGQLLGYLKPVLSNLERGELEAQLATVNKDLLLNQRLLQRVREQAVTGGVNISIQEDAALIEYQGHQARQKAQEKALQGAPQPLRSPVAGVVSRSEIFLGKVVAQGDTLFEVVDPRRLWVEATHYDLTLAGRIDSAYLAGADGSPIPLVYKGQSAQLRNQAVQLQFQIASMPAQSGLAIDQGVQVWVRTHEQVSGVAVPPQAISLRNPTEQVVWVRHAAEVFTPHVVRIVGLDANQHPVVSGITAGDRVVTTDLLALAQAR
ncbi:MAG: hypothetical protein B7Z35_10720 [Hydrogenophilales bacterium 12-61-10]|nr:MAG: hypothetical protein B7Z35_10720 [Hydrogenophilales bacterium 12-61-10]OYX29176.1 MAG: hypothetical protein B7Z03_09795 [Hydrogenophilales bacterium 32-62-9]